MITVKNLTKKYGSKKVLDSVSFSMSEGEILGFLGPNGAGKTTTMRILTAFTTPSSGSIKVDGVDVAEDSLAIRKRIGYLPENNPLYDTMRVYEYLEYAARIKGVADLTAEIKRVVAATNLKEKNRRANQ